MVHADETGTRVGLTQRWVHTLATNLVTLLAVHPKQGIEALDDIGVLGAYLGTIVHDGWAPYEVLDGATHQCGAHLFRHLRTVAETPEFAGWCAAMTAVLLDARAPSEAAAGQPAVARRAAGTLRRRYHNAFDDAFALLPTRPPPRRRHHGPWNIHQRAAWNIASRRRDKSEQVLRLLDDTAVPFDNNTAERALRW